MVYPKGWLEKLFIPNVHQSGGYCDNLECASPIILIHYTMPLMIHVSHIVTENCVWQRFWNVAPDTWFQNIAPDDHQTPARRNISKIGKLRLAEDFEMLGLTPDFETLRQTPVRRPPDATFQNIASYACQTPARRNISKSGVRRKISKSCARRYFLWPCVRRAVRVWLCRQADIDSHCFNKHNYHTMADIHDPGVSRGEKFT